MARTPQPQRPRRIPLRDTRKSFATASGKSGSCLFAAGAGQDPPEHQAAAGVDPHRAGIGAAQLRRQSRSAAEHVAQLANWQPNAPRSDEIPFVVARVVLQDFTGVPLLADLAAMRNVAADMGRDPRPSSRWCRWTWWSTTR